MSRSLAPSPTASVADRGSPRSAAQSRQRGELGVAIEDRFGDAPGQRRAVIQQHIGSMLIEPAQRRDPAGEEGETAGHEHGVGTMRTHRRHQFARARRQANTLPRLLERGDRKPLQHAHPLAQRRLEVEFAVHRARGDLGDARFQASEVGEFVERLAGHDGAVHVGDQQGFAPALGRCRYGVDRGAVQSRAHHRHVRRTGQCDVNGLTRRQDVRHARPSPRPARGRLLPRIVWPHRARR